MDSKNDVEIKKENKFPAEVKYKILIKYQEEYFLVGTIIVRSYTGDILYIPSTKYMAVKDTNGDILMKNIEHIAWHSSGRTHIKYQEKMQEYRIVESKETRQKIVDIGYQDMLTDYIKDFRALKPYKKAVKDLDIKFNVENYIGIVCFHFSIVSGKEIVKNSNQEKNHIKLVNTKNDSVYLGHDFRALGWHSGNSDKLLQYSLRRTDHTFKLEREWLIYYDMKISNT